MPKLKLHRRTVLRGLLGGSVVTVALPTLQAMLNDNGTAYAGGAQLPVRFMTYFWADGVNLGRFEPTTTGPGWVPSEELAPLTPLKEYVSVLTGLQNRSSVAITHHEGMTIFNGYDFIQGGGLNTDAGGPTIDQLIADVVARETPVRAVHVQVSKRVSTDGDGGTTAIAMSHRGTPGNLIVQTPQFNPQLVWQTLFGNFVEQVDTRPPRLRVLDAVREDANRLMAKLGAEDKQRFEAHLLAVDELETKIAATPPVCFLPESPTETNTDVGGQEPISAVTKAMADLIAYAFACDITRVASFMFKRFVSGTVFDEINANEVHHSASHSPGSETYHQGVTYQMQKLFDVLDTLKNTADIGGGNLLDSTIVFASSDCSTGWAHSIARQPIILAGHGRGYLVHPGIHYQSAPWNQDEGGPNGSGNAADALLTCLKCFDPSATTIGGDGCQTSNVISNIIA